jgi:omega-6 fatty acid desaturase (delta-12 desaturase)
MGEQGKFALFPGKWKAKVWQSDVGCVAVVAALAAWAVAAGRCVLSYTGPHTTPFAW